MPCLPFLARAVAFAVFLMGALAASEARAQVLAPTLRQGGVSRDHQDGNLLDTQFNLADCNNDDFFEFSFNAPAVAGTDYDLQVWVSKQEADDCSNSTNQTPATGMCRQAAETVATGYAVFVHVRDIASDAWGSWDGGAASDVCETTYESAVDRFLHFYYLAGSNYSAPYTYKVSFDLFGPGPPKAVKAGIGENALVVSYEEATGTADVSRYRVYAEPVDAPPVDGAGGEGGASEPGQTGDCTSNILRPGQPVPAGIDERGESGPSSLEVEAKGLTNGVRYAVAVASVDAFYNSGNLSTLACATPEPVTGFFEAYREAGGGAGGGYCAIGAATSRLSAAGVALVGLGLILRRRKKRSDRTKGRRAA